MQQSVSEPRASAWRTRAPLTACGVTPALAFSREGTFSFMSQSNAERVALVALLLHMVLPSPHVASVLPEEWERGDEGRVAGHFPRCGWSWTRLPAPTQVVLARPGPWLPRSLQGCWEILSSFVPSIIRIGYERESRSQKALLPSSLGAWSVFQNSLASDTLSDQLTPKQPSLNSLSCVLLLMERTFYLF